MVYIHLARVTSTPTDKQVAKLQKPAGAANKFRKEGIPPPAFGMNIEEVSEVICKHVEYVFFALVLSDRKSVV